MEHALVIRDGEADSAEVALYERTRRDAVRTGLAAGGAVLAASAIPALLRARYALAAARGDAQIVRGALVLEQTAVVAYGAALDGGALRGELAATVGRIRRQEREHARALGAALARLGGTAPAPPRREEVRGLAGLRTRRDVLSFAIELENMAVAAYYEAHQRLREPGLLRTGAQIMANEGQHLVVLRQALGRDPVPRAFETGEGS